MKRNIFSRIKRLYLPEKGTHKGQNGRLLIIGGSHLFHSASLWALQVASRIVDLVHYSSVPENNAIATELKGEFLDGIVIPREEIESYIEEDDCILIGPGMVRTENAKIKMQKSKCKNQDLKEISRIKDEGVQTYLITKYLLRKYPYKRWVIDAGALQMLEPEWIPNKAILTPHRREFELLKSKIPNSKSQKIQKLERNEQAKLFAQKYSCTVLLKGDTDLIVSENNQIEVTGGNAGMTKGGTGDVLAGLVASFYTKNDDLLSALAGSYINKQAGEDLYKKQGYWFNASDLVAQIPQTMKDLFLG